MSALTELTVASIQERCSDTSFERGQNYYEWGAVQQRVRHEDGVETRVAGSQMYRVTVREGSAGVTAYCTCPYDWGGDCKHIVASLLAWLEEPESFRAVGDLRTALAALDKEELISLLVDICASYPNLVDDFNLLGDAAPYEPKRVVGQIFAEIDLQYGEVDIDTAIARMENVSRQATRFVQQGRGALARRIYFELVDHCLGFCEQYGADDAFPDTIPAEYAEAYHDLALEQMEEHGNAIEREVRAMLKGEWAAEILGVQDVLCDLVE